MSKKNGHGGARKGSGRKPKADELHARQKIKKALKIVFNRDDEDEAELDFLVEYATTKDGMKFFAEHLLGKAPDKVDVTSNGEQFSNPLIMFGKENNE